MDGTARLSFTDPVMDLALLHTLTRHGLRGAEIGDCREAVARITDGDPKSWREVWHDLGVRTKRVAGAEEARGHRVSAREAYLRAVTYYRNETVALRPTDPRYRPTVVRSRGLFRRFAALSEPPIEPVAIPYDGAELPGYFLRPDRGKEPRPTIVIGDNVSEELYFWLGPPALERGYNALLVDLPGIGLNPLDGVPFRPDTEHPVGAVVDFLTTRPEVDPERIAVYGGGEPGGYIMTRAAAGEPRIAACVVDPLVSDIGPVAAGFAAHDARAETLGSIMAESGQVQIAHGMRDPEVTRRMTAQPEAITGALLCLNDSADYPELQRQAEAAVEEAPHPASTRRVFTPSEGTRGYRQLDHVALKHRVMFDWLDAVFSGTQRVA